MDKPLNNKWERNQQIRNHATLEREETIAKEAKQILDLSERKIKRLYQWTSMRALRGLSAEGEVNRATIGWKMKWGNKRWTWSCAVTGTLDRRLRTRSWCKYTKISDESVRQLMIAEGAWKPKKARKLVVHQMREHWACFGVLVQIDGAPRQSLWDKIGKNFLKPANSVLLATLKLQVDKETYGSWLEKYGCAPAKMGLNWYNHIRISDELVEDPVCVSA